MFVGETDLLSATNLGQQGQSRFSQYLWQETDIKEVQNRLNLEHFYNVLIITTFWEINENGLAF